MMHEITTFRGKLTGTGFRKLLEAARSQTASDLIGKSVILNAHQVVVTSVRIGQDGVAVDMERVYRLDLEPDLSRSVDAVYDDVLQPLRGSDGD